MPIKNAQAKTWSIRTSADGKRHSSNPNGDAIVAPPPAPALGAISERSGNIKRVSVATFPSIATYLTREVSLNGGAYISAGLPLPSGTTHFDYDVGTATSWSFKSKAGNANGESSDSNIVSGGLVGSGVGSITPTGLTTRPLAEPTLFQAFTDTSTGQTPVQVGFSDWVDRGTGRVDMSVGPFENAGSIYVNQEAAVNAMPHISKFLPTNSDSVFTNFMFRVFRVGNPVNVWPQIKLPRVAPFITGEGNTDYGQSRSKYYASLYFSPIDGHSQSYNSAYWSEADGTEHTSYWEDTNYGGISRSVLSNVMDHWANFEIFQSMNTPDISNGVHSIAVDNKLLQLRTQCRPRDHESTHFSFVQPIPGIDIANSGEYVNWRYAIGRMYIDVNTRTHICRINASTLANATKKFMLKPVAPFTGAAWNYSYDVGAPSDCDWICCIDDAGNSYTEYRPI